jgi:hypothetical protein
MKVNISPNLFFSFIMYLYALVAHGLILILIACTPQKETRSQHYAGESEAHSLPDTSRVIRTNDHVDTIDSAAQGYDSIKSEVPWNFNDTEFIDKEKESIQTKFITAVGRNYAKVDSIKSGLTEYAINFVVEVFYSNNLGKREAALYLLEFSDGPDGTIKGHPKYIGRHDWTVKSLQIPGDFYYYLMTLKRENNIEALIKCIPSAGFQTNLSDGSEDNIVSEENMIKRDSINFENLGFEFDLYKVNFTFNFSIDEVFDAHGHGSFGYSGGGFYSSVSIKKEDEQIFLERYSFNGH